MSALPDILKLTFQLTAHGEDLEVRATGLRGEARAETRAPASLILEQLAQYDPVDIPSAALGSVGKSLYQSLIASDVAKLAADILNDGISLKQPVQFELRFDPDQVALAQYPWEMLADEFNRFLIRDGIVLLSRYISYPQPPPTFDATIRNVPLLRIVSQPATLAPIVAKQLALAQVETLAHASFEELLRKLLIERMALWGLQFDGHGGLVLRCGECNTLNLLDRQSCQRCGRPLSGAKQVGVLAFEKNGDVEWVTAQEFGSILYNAQIRLAMLLACETARIGNQLVFSGLAPSLILAGVPAVVGMQYPVTDYFANSFAESFYSTLLQTNDVLEAMRTARRANLREAWYSPVLYLRHQPPRTSAARQPSYETRDIDTSVPGQAQVGIDFLVRVWLRRPETKPLSAAELHAELDVPEEVPITTRQAQAEVKFEPVAGRKFRLGEVEVRLSSRQCEVRPESIKLFIDERLDAPPALFTVKAKAVGHASLIFGVWQDGGEIASAVHHVQVLAAESRPLRAILTDSSSIPIDNTPPILDKICPNCRQLNRADAKYCNQCGADLARPFVPPQASPSTIICPRCGSENRVNARFCLRCGLPLITAIPSPSSPVPPVSVNPPAEARPIVIGQPGRPVPPYSPEDQPRAAPPTTGSPPYPGEAPKSAGCVSPSLRLVLITILLIMLIAACPLIIFVATKLGH